MPELMKLLEHEIDDAVLASEGNRRFGAFLGQRIEPGSLPAGEHDSEYAKSHIGPDVYCTGTESSAPGPFDFCAVLC